MENDDDIEENKNVTKVDTGDLDSEDDNVDDEKSDEEKNPTWKMIITLKKTRMN